MYKEKFTQSELNHLKASESRELTKMDNLLVFLALATLIFAFAFMVSAVALVLWYGNLTIFITIVSAMPLVFFLFMYSNAKKSYLKDIAKYKERIHSQEKHTI